MSIDNLNLTQLVRAVRGVSADAIPNREAALAEAALLRELSAACLAAADRIEALHAVVWPQDAARPANHLTDEELVKRGMIVGRGGR